MNLLLTYTASPYSSFSINGYISTFLIVYFISTIVFTACTWLIFSKAGEAGWKSLIPIYRYFVLCEISFGSGWWFLGLFIPGVNTIFPYVLMWKLAEAFGRETGFKIFSLFFAPISLIILAFGSDEYYGV